jgi:arylsulfatase A-like enzyme
LVIVLTNAGRIYRSMRFGAAVATAIIGLGCGENDEAPKRQPNIILIVADTLRQDYLGMYGFEGDVSPRMDRFSERSVLFENAISAAPWTKPSVASIFTSLRPEAHRLMGSAGQDSNLFETLNANIPTVASELRDAGYETVAFYSNPWLAPASGLGRGFDRYERTDGPADAVSEHGLRFMKTREGDRPFFMYLHYLDVHGPYDCPQSEYLKLQNSPSLGTDRALTNDEHTALRYLRGTKTPWLEDRELRRTLRFWRTCYASGVSRFDARLAKLLTTLENDPWSANTAVLFTSDHGEALLEHGDNPLGQRLLSQPGWWEHGRSLQYHQNRVPLILRLPAGAHGGTRVKGAVSTLDIMPTLLDLANAPLNPSPNGRSLLPYLRADEDGSRWVVSSGVKMRSELHSIQNHNYKLILGTLTKDLALYDLKKDPKELNNIAEQRSDLVADLKTIAESDLDRLEHVDPHPDSTKIIEPSIIEELRALGYVGD